MRFLLSGEHGCPGTHCGCSDVFGASFLFSAKLSADKVAEQLWVLDREGLSIALALSLSLVSISIITYIYICTYICICIYYLYL